MFFVVLCPGTPEGSTGSGSGFKASQKMGQRLKVSYFCLSIWTNSMPNLISSKYLRPIVFVLQNI